MTVLVLGGTGTVGGQVVRQLAAQGVPVRAMTRTADKAAGLASGIEGVVGDLADPASLGRAFAGAESVFLLTPLSRNETQEGRNAVDAAKAAGARRIVYMSVYRMREGRHIPHFRSKIPVAEAVAGSGIAFTILQPNAFFQNDLWFQEAILEHAVYPQPFGHVGVSSVDVRDVADAAVNALLQPGHEGQSYPVVGPEALTGPRVAEIYGRHLGRAVRYVGDDLEAFAAGARRMMPDWQVEDILIMYRYFLDQGMAAAPEEVERSAQLVGHPPRSLDAFIDEVFIPAVRDAGGGYT